jgi:DNA-binding response OmpR family regulator
VGSGQAGGKSIPPYRDEHLKIDFDQETALLDDGRLVLTRKEYALLALLVEHAGQIIPRDALLMQVWGYGAEVKTRTLDVHVRRLRKKLGRFAEQYIETIFGIGYRFQPYPAPRFMGSGSGKPAIALGALGGRGIAEILG